MSAHGKDGLEVVLLPPEYRPHEEEDFMGPQQQAYFRKKLLAWRSDLLKSSENTLRLMRKERLSYADSHESMSLEASIAARLETRARERRLLDKIETALTRLEEGTYGYCIVTLEPIPLRRLEARPVATMTLEAQERYEHMARQKSLILT